MVSNRSKGAVGLRLRLGLHSQGGIIIIIDFKIRKEAGAFPRALLRLLSKKYNRLKLFIKDSRAE